MVSRFPEPGAAGPTPGTSCRRIPRGRRGSWGVFKPCLQHPLKAAPAGNSLSSGNPKNCLGNEGLSWGLHGRGLSQSAQSRGRSCVCPVTAQPETGGVPTGSPGEGHPGAQGSGGPCTVPSAPSPLPPECRSQNSGAPAASLGLLCHCVPNLLLGDGDDVLPSASSLAPHRRDEPQPQQHASSGAAHPCTLHGHLLPAPDRAGQATRVPSPLLQPECLALVVSIHTGKPRHGQQPAESNRPWWQSSIPACAGTLGKGRGAWGGWRGVMQGRGWKRRRQPGSFPRSLLPSGGAAKVAAACVCPSSPSRDV